MEYKFRGWVEKELDRILEQLSKVAKLSENFPLKSVEDFCFGHIVGQICASSQAQALMYFKREITPEEWEEVKDTVIRRTIQIKGEIKLALGR